MKDFKQEQFEANLIKEVRKNECIWNKEHTKYANIQALNFTWCKIAFLCNEDESMCRQTWKSLHGEYMRLMNTPEGNYKTADWHHLKSLSFLYPTVELDKSDKNYESDATDNFDLQSEDDKMDEELPYMSDMTSQHATENTEEVEDEDVDCRLENDTEQMEDNDSCMKEQQGQLAENANPDIFADENIGMTQEEAEILAQGDPFFGALLQFFDQIPVQYREEFERKVAMHVVEKYRNQYEKPELEFDDENIKSEDQ